MTDDLDLDDDLVDLESNATDATARRISGGEGVKAYAGFTSYMSLDPARRSLTAAYGLYLERQGRPETGAKQARNGQEKNVSPPGYFRAWAVDWSWSERAAVADRRAEAEATRLHLEGRRNELEAVRQSTMQAGKVKQAFFGRVSRLCFSRLDGVELRDRRAAEDDARADAEENDGGKKRRKVLTATPFAEVTEIVRAMRAACSIVDSGKSDAVDSSEVAEIYRLLKQHEKMLESQEEY